MIYIMTVQFNIFGFTHWQAHTKTP